MSLTCPSPVILNIPIFFHFLLISDGSWVKLFVINTFYSNRSTDENKTEKNQKDIPSITVEVDKSADIDNHNELSDLIQEDESEDVKEIDSS